MKKLTILTLILFAACVPVKLAIPTQADADRGAKQFNGFTLAELNQGKTLYEQNCAECHRLKYPRSKTEAEWTKIVPNMVRRANRDAGREKIKPHDQELILHYVITMSTAKPVDTKK